MSNEWSLAAVADVVSAAVPDREMVVCGTTRRTYAEGAARSRGLAAFLRDRGLGVHRDRDELERWECGQDTVAIVLRNSAEYLESLLGCLRARTVPFNVNHHYQPAEIAALFDMVGPAAVVVHRSLGPLVAAAVDPTSLVVLDVDDGSGVAPLPGSTPYEAAVATPVGELPVPSPDDLYMVCTGGTTGAPKAVLWRQGDAFVAAMAGSDATTAESLAEAAVAGGARWFPAAPLMHAAAQWTAFSGLHAGATIVLHDERRSLDARAVLELAEAEEVNLVSIVGDAFAHPMVDELRRRPYDVSSLAILATGGAATNERHKEALLELIPSAMVVDGYGSSETGGMAFGARARGSEQAGFAPAAGAVVLSEDRTRVLGPGEDEVGWTARFGRVPLGYLGDPERTEATFPIVDGQRASVPGDRARVADDGTIVMLGRDAMVVNTGGEKVFVEEVEEALRAHPGVVDALVVGRPSDRFGQEVVALVQLRDGTSLTPNDLREHVGATIARFKAPRAVAICDEVARLANGKADYRWARAAALDAVDATTP